MTANCLTLRLEPLANSELIAGSLCDERGTEHHFAGWLGLLTLLEQARLANRDETEAGTQEVQVASAEPSAIPEGNVERIRWSIDAADRGDLDGMLESWAPDAVLDWSNSRGFDAGVYRGHAEIRAFMMRFRGTFEEVRTELLGDPVEIEEGLFVVENISYLRGRDGIEVQARSAWLTTIRDGQTTSLTLYQTKQEALEAART